MTSRQRLGVVLGLLAFVLGGLALRAAGVEREAAWVGATVLWMATWWITEPLPLWGTALLPVVVFPLLGAAPLWEVVLQYLDPVIFLFLGGMWIAAAMEQQDLHRRMALGIVARIGASPRQIVLGFMLATGFVSLWISNTAAAVMMFPIAMAVLRRFEEQLGREDPLQKRLGLALMLGIAYAASMAGVGSKIGTGTNLVFVKQAARILPTEVTFVDWFKIGLPVVLVSVPLAWLYLVRVAAPLPSTEMPGGRAAILEARRQLGRIRRGEAVALAAFLLAAFLWVFRQEMDFKAFQIRGWAALVPWEWSDLIGRPVSSLPRPLSDLLGPRGAESMVALLVGIALIVIPMRVGPVQTTLSLRRAASVSWGLLVLIGGGFAMAFGIEESGLSAVLGSVLGQLPAPTPYIALVVACLAAIALSEVASNTATASILLPLLGTAAPSFGLHPAVMMIGVTIAASFGFMLPAGTPPNAVVFASGYIPVTRMARSGLVVDIVGGVVVATLCYFIAPWALGLGK